MLSKQDPQNRLQDGVMRKEQRARAHRITSVFVEGLFGLHTYNIQVSSTPGAPGPSLLILYGDNGTGKTTILQLVYHLLGREDNRGHRGYLARIPFRRLRVTLDPATTIEADRKSPNLVGGYRLRITKGTTVVSEVEAITDPNLIIQSSTWRPEHRQRWQSFIQALAALDLTFFFLADDRKSYDPRDTEMPAENLDMDSVLTHTLTWQRVRDLRSGDLRLEEIVERLEKWIRDEALKGTNVGEAGTNTVYADIAKRIAQAQRPGRASRAASDNLVESLAALESRSKPFAALGLVSPPKLTEIVNALQSSSAGRRQLIANVVSPYVDSLRARLDALQEIQEILTLFLESINSFFGYKTVSYDLARGLEIATPQGPTLKPSQLSSGERQLLALLAQVLIARRAATVFLIDEPEISLNVKWQRVLVDTLLRLVRGTDVQFILATHSLELLATHRDHVHRLAAPLKDNDIRAV
jgi:energy-coupling factor transporter ATP-binding protein EcfA2